MVVHIGEMNADIRPAEPGPETGNADGRSGGGRTSEDAWEELQCRLTWLRARTAATGFDD